MGIVMLILCICVTGVFGQQGMPQPGVQFPPGQFQRGGTGTRPGFGTSGPQTFQPQPGGGVQIPPQPGVGPGGFGPQTGGPFPGRPMFGPGGGSVFGPMGPLRPLSPPLSPMAMMMASLAQNPNNYRYATCNFNDTWSPVRGRMDLRQFLIGEGRQQVQIRIQISGLPQSVSEVDRGIHVHEFGDTGDGCARVGPHFNPNQTPHGSQRNFAFLRHVGDLGNIRQSAAGLVSTQFVDQVISLEGSNNVVGRAFVIKVERDDLGLGGSRESRVNGNTHNPIACCTIGRTTARNWYNPMSAGALQNMAATGIMPYNTIDPFNTNTLVNTGINTGGMPNTGPGGNTGFPTSGMNPGFSNSGMGPTFQQTGFPLMGFGGTGGISPPGFGPQSGFRPQPGFGPQAGSGTPGIGQPGFGSQSGFRPQPGFGPQTGTGTPGIAQSGFGPQSGIRPQPGFGPGGMNTQPGQGGLFQGGISQRGLTQGGLSQGGLTQGGLTQGGLTQGGLTQGGFSPGGLSQSGLSQGGLTQSGFSGTGPGSQTFGAGTFVPGAAPGQVFNFAAQGRRK